MKSLIPWKKHEERQVGFRKGANHTLDSFHRYVDEQFQSFLNEMDLSDGPGWMPSLNLESSFPVGFEVSETDDAFEVRAELPGMDEKDISIVLDEERLTISGEKTEEGKRKKRNVHYNEIRYGAFHRSFPLPAGIDREQTRAEFKKGVLTLTLPRTAEAREQRKVIPIQTA
ncbi:Hsp20/alpha crystallin family protein [Kiritimatiellaeota bacterium B1221]|nr:Hsp20/alpha crystallin family protein [Kiritimatiellaeota bacterium B1221]